MLRQSGLSDVKQHFDNLEDSISGSKAKIAVLEHIILTRLPEPLPTLAENGPLTSTLVQPEGEPEAEATILQKIGNLTTTRSTATTGCHSIGVGTAGAGGALAKELYIFIFKIIKISAK